MIIYWRLNSDEFAKLLQDINTNNFERDGLRINFFADPVPPLRLQYRRYRGDSLRAKERWSIDWPVDFYEWKQSHKLQNQLDVIFKEIDTKLHCFDPPYRNVEEAVNSILELPRDYFEEDQSRDSKCSILLPNFVAIERANLEGNKLEVIARFHESVGLEDFAIRDRLWTQNKQIPRKS